ncbi:hypothetical protein Z043_115865 [Scleropages formosus]|uniref:SoHo domain-containing protein n=1 Tax=Scleropages formosus TaxID=113540 RepID=A0A0N8JY69_SCLFO|nr:hypothetical protein Z043_115865 [Scleropages formosus]
MALLSNARRSLRPPPFGSAPRWGKHSSLKCTPGSWLTLAGLHCAGEEVQVSLTNTSHSFLSSEPHAAARIYVEHISAEPNLERSSVKARNNNTSVRRRQKRQWEGRRSKDGLKLLWCCPCLRQQRHVEVLDHLNGSRIVFSDAGAGGPGHQSPADLTQDVVVISPGLPTPPRSPSHRRSAAERRSSEVNGGGPPVLSFGSYYGQSQSSGAPANGNWSGTAATLPRSARAEERLVKFSGIGPVDETGMPIASRSSVNKPKDWYRSMFRQIHKKAAGKAPA